MSVAKYVVYLTGIWTYALIVWGGYVTLGGYGLGCGTYWPTYNGMIFPTLTWPVFAEYVHRLLTIVTGIFLIASVVAVLKMKPRPSGAAKALGLSVVLLVIQSLLGGDMVVSDLEPTIATLHLALATAVFAMIVAACILMHFWEKTASDLRPLSLQYLKVSGKNWKATRRGKPRPISCLSRLLHQWRSIHYRPRPDSITPISAR